MKIFITVATGFIGSHLFECLAKKGHEVVGIDNLSDYYDVNLKLDNIECTKKVGVQFLKADLRNLEAYSNIGDDFDFIYHFAAQPGLSKDSTFESYLDNNVVATKTLIEFTKTQKQLKHFFYNSTSSIYGKYATVSEEVAPPRSGDQQQIQANIDKAKLLLNYHPKTSFEVSIKQQIEWYKSKMYK